MHLPKSAPLALLTFLVFSAAAFAQPAQINRSRSLLYTSAFQDAVPDGSGGFTMSYWEGDGTHWMSPGISYFVDNTSLLRLDSTGTELFLMPVPYPYSTQGGTDLIHTSDGGYMLAMTDYDICYMEWWADRYFVKFNASGDTVWSATSQGDFYSMNFDCPVTETPWSSFVIGMADDFGFAIAEAGAAGIAHKTNVSTTGLLSDLEYANGTQFYAACDSGLVLLDSSGMMIRSQNAYGPAFRVFPRTDTSLFFSTETAIYRADSNLAVTDTFSFSPYFAARPWIWDNDTSFWMMDNSSALLLADDFTILSTTPISCPDGFIATTFAADEDQLLLAGYQEIQNGPVSAVKSWSHAGADYAPDADIALDTLHFSGASYGVWPGFTPYVHYDLGARVKNTGTDTLHSFTFRANLRGTYGSDVSCSARKIYQQFSGLNIAPGDTFYMSFGTIDDHPVGPAGYTISADVSSPNGFLDTDPSNNYRIQGPDSIPLASDPAIVDDRRLEVFPNPASGDVSISVENALPSRCDIRLYSLTGTEIKSEQDVHSFPFRMNLSGIAPGIYLIEMTGDGQPLFQKVVIR